MWKKIALGLGAIVVVLAAVIALQPSSFMVERSVSIDAPSDIVSGYIQNLRAMDAWSPFVEMDPQMKIAYDGPEAGVGARSSWEGPQMGSGRLTITAVKDDRRIEMKLEMMAPVKATHRILFGLRPYLGTTRVAWRMDGTNGFVGKALGLLVNMDEMVGGPFEQGLASLKRLAEADAEKRRAR